MPAEQYEIIVSAWLDSGWSEWFEGMTITNLESGEAILAGTLPDQSALHCVISKIRDLNLTLISVNLMKGKGEE